MIHSCHQIPRLEIFEVVASCLGPVSRLTSRYRACLRKRLAH